MTRQLVSAPSRLVLWLPQLDSGGDVENHSLFELHFQNLKYERQLMTYVTLKHSMIWPRNGVDHLRL